MAIDIEKLEDSPHLLDLLIQMEDVLDSLDIYVFKNWIDGEIVEGPKVRRYWLDMTLKFSAEKMPDPRAGLRLLKHGVRVDFEKATEEAEDGAGRTEDTNEPSEDEKTDKVWLVRISIPRRLVREINAGELDFYDDELDDVEDVQDAQDGGMTDESGYTDQGGPDSNGQGLGSDTPPPVGGMPNA